MEVNDELHNLATLSLGKEPLDRRLGRTQSKSGQDGKEKNSLLLSGIEPQLAMH
jgi:hypothetical protein